MVYNLSRFRNIEKLEYTCEVITPMFLSGADTEKAEIRSASVKGALRFWWRALYNYNLLSGNYGTDELTNMQDMENQIFGDTNNKSRVRIIIEPVSIETSNDPLDIKFPGEKYSINGKKFKGDILKYLALGCATEKDKRSFIEPLSFFKIILESPSTLEYKNENSTIKLDLLDELKKVMKAFALFGGLGSKSRNGFGSIKIKDKMNITRRIENNNPTDFTHVNKNIEIFRTIVKYNTWNEALSKIGLAYRNARMQLEPSHSYNKRAEIASPIPIARINGRQPKQIFLRVTKSNENRFTGKIYYLPIKLDDKNKQVYEEFLLFLKKETKFIK